MEQSDLVLLQREILGSPEFGRAFDDMDDHELLFMLAAALAMTVHSVRRLSGQTLPWQEWLDGFALEMKWQKS